MPKQDFDRAPPLARSERTPRTRPKLLWLRRLFVIGGAALLALWGTIEMDLVLNSVEVSLLGCFVLALFALLGAWISLAFTSALAGFFQPRIGVMAHAPKLRDRFNFAINDGGGS